MMSLNVISEQSFVFLVLVFLFSQFWILQVGGRINAYRHVQIAGVIITHI